MTTKPIPQHLQIRVIHADDDIVVIDKPANLRSVPGHADSPTDTSVKLKRPSDRLSAAEAWVKAIKSIPRDDDDADDHDVGEAKIDSSVKEILRNIRTTNNPSSIPRKVEPFARYVFRNRKRLLPSYQDGDEPDDGDCEPQQKKQKRDMKQSTIPASLRKAADAAFSFIQKLYIPLLNLPTPTEDWESALGQLRLLGYGDFANENDTNLLVRNGNSKLHIVHRLDCQTSGVMLFARNPETASKLCEAWRERNSVQKTYLAHVMRWPPYEDEKLEEGIIELGLAASRTERIKWEVRELSDGGKTSITKWKIYKGTNDNDGDGDGDVNTNTTNEGFILELSPITGRTHQLRIHCAEIGSGITGDSLYGDSPVKWFKESDQHQNGANGADTSRHTILRLHSHVLSLRHPRDGEKVTFKTPRLW